MAQQFYTEGMTVEDILNITPYELSKLSTRDLSRALRTVSLAANKRVARLQKYAVHGKISQQGYISKGTSSQIATDALNFVTNLGTKRGNVFGVSKAKTKSGKISRNKMLSQLKLAKDFMSMTTSTVKGATKVRQRREKALFGQTREQAAKGLKYKYQREAIYKKFESKYNEVWEYYHKFLESIGRDAHAQIFDSAGIQNVIGSMIIDNELDPNAKPLTEQEILDKAREQHKQNVDKQTEEREARVNQNMWRKPK